MPKLHQGITFDALADKTFGDPDFALFATASSGLSVSYAASGNCTVAGNTVHLTGDRELHDHAPNQAGDSELQPAPSAEQSFAIALRCQGADGGVARARCAFADDGRRRQLHADVQRGGHRRHVEQLRCRRKRDHRRIGWRDQRRRHDVDGDGEYRPRNGIAAPRRRQRHRNHECDGHRAGGNAVHRGNVPDRQGRHVIGSGEGRPVAGFGSSGYALFSDVQDVAAPTGLAVLADGRILAAGGTACTFTAVTSSCTLQLARYSASGTPDASFGTNGRVLTAVTNINSELSALIVNADGTFFVNGSRGNGTAEVPFVAKFTSAGASGHGVRRPTASRR